MSLINLLFALNAVACPTGAPAGYAVTPDTSERAYSNKEKTIQLIVKCDANVKPADTLAALKLLGEVHASGQVSYVNVKPGALRIYVAKDTQLSVVAKTPEALNKVAPALIEYLQK